MTLGFGAGHGPRTIYAVTKDKPVYFTHRRHNGGVVSPKASGTLLTQAIWKAICSYYLIRQQSPGDNPESRQ
jgi:hypothetical protein